MKVKYWTDFGSSDVREVNSLRGTWILLSVSQPCFRNSEFRTSKYICHLVFGIPFVDSPRGNQILLLSQSGFWDSVCELASS